MPEVKQKPVYYVRMFKGRRWFFLRSMVYNKKSKAMEPRWWPEDLMGDTQPYLYKTLAKARNLLDRIEVISKVDVVYCMVKRWDGDNAQTETRSH